MYEGLLCSLTAEDAEEEIENTKKRKQEEKKEEGIRAAQKEF